MERSAGLRSSRVRKHGLISSAADKLSTREKLMIGSASLVLLGFYEEPPRSTLDRRVEDYLQPLKSHQSCPIAPKRVECISSLGVDNRNPECMVRHFFASEMWRMTVLVCARRITSGSATIRPQGCE
jgi:hypothetical protein